MLVIEIRDYDTPEKRYIIEEPSNTFIDEILIRSEDKYTYTFWGSNTRRDKRRFFVTWEEANNKVLELLNNEKLSLEKQRLKLELKLLDVSNRSIQSVSKKYQK